MWIRAELKKKAKSAIKNNYWYCILAAFLIALIGGGHSDRFELNLKLPYQIASLFEDEDDIFYEDDIDDSFDADCLYPEDDFYGNACYDDEDDFASRFMELLITVVIVLLGIAGIILLLGLLFKIFVVHPFAVGGCRFFIENSYSTKTSAGTLFYAFVSGNYKNITATMFFRSLYTFLWSLLFIVPGIVKSYEYRMVPYLLADCPDMPREDAFAISKELMTGNKWNAFVLDLSFWGWNILNAGTLGILGVFWLNPYIHATNAELFLALKKDYFSGEYISKPQVSYGDEF